MGEDESVTLQKRPITIVIPSFCRSHAGCSEFTDVPIYHHDDDDDDDDDDDIDDVLTFSSVFVAL